MRRRLAVAAATLLAVAAVGPAAAQAAPPVVSLTFDDAVDLPEPAGLPRDRVDDFSFHALHTLPPLRATFYLNSAIVGSRFGFTTAALQQMVAAGDELGGHTVHHLDLPRLEDDAELRRQACGDRKALSVLPRLDGGTFDITSFAYPNGDFAWPDGSADTRVIDIIAGAAQPGPVFGGCAYSSARATGGVVPTTTCAIPATASACVLRNLPTLPLDPALRFRIPTPASLDAANGSARLATLRAWVGAAERAGTAVPASTSPWLVLVFHHLCAPPADPATPCAAKHAVRDDDFMDLVAWLKAEQTAGRLAVRTVTGALDAASGTVTKERPLGADAFPAVTAQPAVRNATMDLDTPLGDGAAASPDGRADCFDISNDAAGAGRRQLRQADGTTGWVTELTVARGAEQRFTVRPDLGGCAVGTTPGVRYRLSVRYRVTSTGLDAPPPPGAPDPALSPFTLFAFTRSATAASGTALDAPHRYTGRFFAAPGGAAAMPWPVRTGWRTASCVTASVPAGRDAIAPGLGVRNADDAPGVAGLRDPLSGAITVLVDDITVERSTAAATCLG